MSRKKGGKRMSMQQMSAALRELFTMHPTDAFTRKDVYRRLKLSTHPTMMLASDAIDTLVWEDFLTKDADGAYRLNNKTQVQEGIFRRKSNGKNSFAPDDGSAPVFVAERNSMGALDGDRVQATVLARREKHMREAMVTAIIERKRDTFVGTLRVEHDWAVLVMPSSIFVNDIIIPRSKTKKAATGDKVLVKVVQWPDADHKNIVGEVVDVLGPKGDNDVEMHSILAQYGLPYKYPRGPIVAANKISEEIGDIANDSGLSSREDFRPVFTCTIDPHDAKDFDDALSLRRLDNGLWEVGVHIADVSHYVREGDPIDHEALKRATSVYLVDRTIPMLPERLCNLICSLRPDEDKLAYSVVFNLDDDANVRSWRLVQTIIRSKRRYAYEEVQQILEDNGVVDGTGEPAPPAPQGGYRGDHADELIRLDALAKKLRKARFKGGSVKFDRDELHFDVDDQGRPTRCYYKHSRDANKLIEEFMLLANRTVAEYASTVDCDRGKNRKPKVFVYRVHDQPDQTKLETLREFVVKFGYKMKTTGTKAAISRSLNTLMDQCAGRKEQKLIETVALRAMMKAKYSVDNIGHYGLAFDYYAHFTSPIRRYPDLLVHRLLKKYQTGSRSANRKHYEGLCEHCSDMEQLAQNAERDSIKYKMVEYMADKIGNVYDAHISGITSYGIYCEIDDNHCEGMVPMRDLSGDYYDFDERNYCLVGRRHHHKYQLGDPVRIQVARADVERKLLDFTIAKD